MNEENNEPKVPHFENEPMKMPENSTRLPVETEEVTVTNGLVLGLLVVLLLLILGGMYYWFSTLQTASPTFEATAERPTAEENNEPESTTAEAQAQNLEILSTSDELSAIEADIAGTDLESLDIELQSIEAELNAAIQ